LKTTLIIATYDWPKALEAVLLSVVKQSLLPDEIIIADDGSTKETKLLIDRYSQKFNTKLQHIWQVDNGFQKTSILNKAVARAKGEYIIQIDGDILLHHHFIKDHISTAKKGTFIHGSRVFINKKITKEILSKLTFKFSIFKTGISNRFNGLHTTYLSKIISSKNNSLTGTRGCNFSFWKTDFKKVNGYNEDMKGWGKEDTELSVRLMNIGLQKYKLKCLAICYHLHHNFSTREGMNINNTILATTIKKNKISCANGINKYANGN
tara:strand:+ start:41 stop:835 length:795 start_codon:yes stop_codon:yes gene_type:complete